MNIHSLPLILIEWFLHGTVSSGMLKSNPTLSHSILHPVQWFGYADHVALFLHTNSSLCLSSYFPLLLLSICEHVHETSQIPLCPHKFLNLSLQYNGLVMLTMLHTFLHINSSLCLSSLFFLLLFFNLRTIIERLQLTYSIYIYIRIIRAQ